MVTATGLLAVQSGDVAPHGLTSFNSTYDIHTKFNGDLICRFDVMISALPQDSIYYSTNSHQIWGEYSQIISDELLFSICNIPPSCDIHYTR